MHFTSPRRLLLVLGALAVLVFGALLTLSAWRDYQQEHSALEDNLQEKARLLAEHAELSFATAALVLSEIQERIRHDGLEPFEEDIGYWHRMQDILTHAPQLAQFGFMDTQGRIRFSTSRFPAGDVDISDREYYTALFHGADQHIGSPIVGRIDPRPIIPMSLRLSGPEGAFQGVLFASLRINYFQDFYSNIQDRSDLRIGMFRRDGTLLAMYPEPSAAPSAQTQRAAGALMDRAETGNYRIESPIDGSQRMLAYRNLNDYPVAVTATYDYRAFLSNKIYPVLLRHALIFSLCRRDVPLGLASSPHDAPCRAGTRGATGERTAESCDHPSPAERAPVRH